MEERGKRGEKGLESHFGILLSEGEKQQSREGNSTQNASINPLFFFLFSHTQGK